MKSVNQLKAVDFDQNRNTLRYKLRPIRTPDDLQAAMEKLLGDKAGMLAPREGRKFFTFGSCFAVNIGSDMKARGAEVYTTRVTEDVNSPFNNAALLRSVFLNEHTDIADELVESTGIDYDEFRHELTSATDVIFTLGNIFRLEGDEGHTVVATKDTKLVRETFQETVDCLRDIFRILAKFTTARIFVSVSPIPISGYIGTEFGSAIEADCASKCQLIAAIRTLDGFTYIPTFEIFRWLPAHQEFSTFGADRDNSRHLWGSHVWMVMRILCGK